LIEEGFGEIRTAVSRGGVGETMPIGNEVQDQGLGPGVIAGTSSKKPATMFTTPSPLTAPRTKLFRSTGRSGGQICAK
jgi:hypothetical protein